MLVAGKDEPIGRANEAALDEAYGPEIAGDCVQNAFGEAGEMSLLERRGACCVPNCALWNIFKASGGQTRGSGLRCRSERSNRLDARDDRERALCLPWWRRPSVNDRAAFAHRRPLTQPFSASRSWASQRGFPLAPAAGWGEAYGSLKRGPGK